MLTNVLSFLGTFGLTTAAAVAAAYAAFKVLSEKWLSKKFAEQLELFKHEQQRELESLRLRINTTFDRTVKLHASEFEVLPKIWHKMNEAMDYASSFTSSFQRLADLNRLNDAQLEDFLAKTVLTENEKEEVRRAADKTGKYAKLSQWEDLRRTWKYYFKFASYLQSKGIFIQAALKTDMEDLRAMMWEAIHEKDFDLRHPRTLESRTEKAERLQSDGRPLLDKIGDEIRQRLWTSASLPIADTIVPAEAEAEK